MAPTWSPRVLLVAADVSGDVVLEGPLAVKLGSTGWRFVRYYAGAAAYVRLRSRRGC